MSSQKSTAVAAVAPKRERGRFRVAAIMDAAAALFAERGYDAATMTEIAARSKTAIGSLYRFFPTKESLADALLTRYGDLMTRRLDEITEAAASLSSSALADSLIDLMLERQADRAAALVLIEAHSSPADKRSTLRAVTHRRIATLLVSVNGTLPQARAETMAMLLLHVLKAVPMLACEGGEIREDLLAETRELVRLYVAHIMRPTGEGVS
ncbi:TetR/AcrR family transcriptional regulator [Beijerinckia indica]|uniref:Transcriptional regulator, TetR family n=1 Tax=Beijerinckia indica subsp. indica (strain ATCC 9039 / DSM 1715 / NCIMB 8712) TaxID=395963 RepID=B2IGN8_BEII9|nr:TetR/AcrR family transcriptional regulator [Beijerinckia indica]ACB95799.1 transcriptional regulator, TetR family [Beijerinckia indica subsp. indica ATCC 9039]